MSKISPKLNRPLWRNVSESVWEGQPDGSFAPSSQNSAGKLEPRKKEASKFELSWHFRRAQKLSRTKISVLGFNPTRERRGGEVVQMDKICVDLALDTD